ncbi:MAG: DUF2262 domain-containing protein [Opitutaceae bacterium]|nr:DUF2262 domain-containing protein [Opitutaceae bacterium]
MTFDLPRDTDAFLRCADWDFSLTHDGGDLQVSMQEIAGVSEDQELAQFKKVVLGIIGKKEESLSLAADRFFAEFIEKWNCGAPMSRDEFVARLKPCSITIESDHSAAMEFEDEEDMFRGHAIVVRFDPESEIVGADLEG